jgi:hypothetical protein
MGIIYKLKPEIKDFILGQKKADPNLSCRNLSNVIEQKFQLKVSKSSINAVLKEAGLSLPVGRRQKRQKITLPIPEDLPKLSFIPLTPIPVQEAKQIEVRTDEAKEVVTDSGVVLLKAADYLLGGGYQFTEVIRKHLNLTEKDLLTKTEALIYAPLFETTPEISSYLNDLQSVRPILLDLFKLIPTVLKEVNCIKVSLSDNSIFYLDGQLHTVWSTHQIPDAFSTTINISRGYIKQYFQGDSPFILFTAPGYDMSSKEFFNLLLGLEGKKKGITTLSLFGHKLEEIEAISLEPGKKYLFIVGLWPWQYLDYRQVKKIEGFKPFYFEPLNREFYVAEVEIELWQPPMDQRVTLKGYALKTNLSEKTRLLILGNLGTEEILSPGILNLYLSHWPNLEEGFQDFSRKIELFTFTGDSQAVFHTETIKFIKEIPQDIQRFFYNYLMILDLYVKSQFLPPEYENQDFSIIKEQFYDLKALIQEKEDYVQLRFQPPHQYPYLKDLQYACHRLNEKEIISPSGKRMWFTPVMSSLKKPLS